MVLVVNVLLLNKTQQEKNFTAINVIFAFDVNDVKRLKS